MEKCLVFYIDSYFHKLVDVTIMHKMSIHYILHKLIKTIKKNRKNTLNFVFFLFLKVR